MILTTKYELGQTVFAVRDAEHRRLKNRLTCNATGKVSIGDEGFVCPKCGGASAYPQFAGKKFFVDVESKVGKIDVELYTDMHAERNGCPPYKVAYMLESTGVGSGTCWNEEKLFPTLGEAEAFCDAHNRELPQDDEGAEQRPQQVRTHSICEMAEAS